MRQDALSYFTNVPISNPWTASFYKEGPQDSLSGRTFVRHHVYVPSVHLTSSHITRSPRPSLAVFTYWKPVKSWRQWRPWLAFHSKTVYITLQVTKACFVQCTHTWTSKGREALVPVIMWVVSNSCGLHNYMWDFIVIECGLVSLEQ